MRAEYAEERMDVRLQDILVMKKPHPCGSDRLRCCGCGHEVLLPRSKAEKSIKKIVRDE